MIEAPSSPSLHPEPGSLYLGRDVVVSMLRPEHIHELYPRRDVINALRSYRPWYEQTGASLQVVAERLSWLASLEPPPEIEALVSHRRSGTPLGFLSLAGLDPLNQKAEFSAAFFRGRGSRPALEALHWAMETIFSTLNVEKLIFHVLPDNHDVLRLLHQLDIQLEARLRLEIRLGDGHRSDLLRYAVFRDAWQNGTTRSRLRRLVPLAPVLTTAKLVP